MTMHPDDLPAYVEFLEADLQEATGLIRDLRARVFGNASPVWSAADPEAARPERGRLRRRTDQWMEVFGDVRP